MNSYQHYADNKIKVRVTFASGKSKWGWVHNYNNKWWLTRGNKVGFSLENAVSVEPMVKEASE